MREGVPARHVFVVCLLVLFGVASMAADGGNEWPGWRGTNHGQVVSELPTEWSKDKEVLWRAVPPGSGHSSPIMWGDSVYVTTAYGSSGTLMQHLTGRAALLLAVLLTAASLRMGLWRWHPAARPTIGQALAASASVAGALALLLLVLFGERLLDFARCPIRSWIAASLFASLCLGVAAMAPIRTAVRASLLLPAVFLSAAILFGVPAKDHAFRGGFQAPNLRVMLLTSAIPMGIVLLVMAATAPRRWRRPLTAIGAVTAAGVAGWFLITAFTYREGTLPPIDTLESHFGPRMTAASVLFIAISAASWRLVLRAHALAYLRLVCSGAAVILAAVLMLDRLALRSPYLAYHIGTPQIELSVPLGWALAAVAVLAIDCVILLGTARETRTWVPRRGGVTFVMASLALALAFFTRFNYLQGDAGLIRAIVSIDRETGQEQWRATGLEGAEELTDRRNSSATPTPVTDGQRVCAYYGNSGAMCTDMSGKILWERRDLRHDNVYGAGFSPAMATGVLILAGETPSGAASALGLDTASGALLWRRDYTVAPTNTGHSRTPLVRTSGGRESVILWGVDSLRALDTRTGTELWTRQIGSSGDFVASLIRDQTRLYMASGNGTMALDLPSLDRGEPGMIWTQPAARANCASPVLCNGLLLAITDRGIVTAVDVNTGDIRWRHRLQGDFSSSPIATRQGAYFTNTDGVTTILACEGASRVIATNDMGEGVTASPAGVAGRLYLRTATALYSIGPAQLGRPVPSP